MMYLEDTARARNEREFDGTPEEFLRTLELRLTLAEVTAADLDRAEELVTRTNQLNSTGIVYFEVGAAVLSSDIRPEVADD